MATAELTIEIQNFVENPTSIAIAPFGWEGTTTLPENIDAIVAADLERSGQFRAVPQSDMLAFPKAGDTIYYRNWRVLKAEYLLVGTISEAAGRYRVTYELYDVFGQRRLLAQPIDGSVSQLRDLAHYISDSVYETLTGIRGAFSTKIIYVEARKAGSGSNKEKFRLIYADADGAREQVIHESDAPIMSPAWSPDGKQVAYVSFETSRAAVFRQELSSGKREQLTNFKGLNGAPAWSPDGQKLAMVLSKDGNPEIYTLDLTTRRFTRITRHFAIDTEPNWTNDGKGIIFTSNRGGRPQIYQVTLASGRVERLTFEGDYNARPRVSPDGKHLVMVHRHNGIYHIATQELVSGDIRVLTETRLDESPSIAPNGAMLMYATRYNGKGILAAVSLDAGVKVRLPSKLGDAREPAWSPYLN
ncbi:Tol-Pal system beta propeller repeat protein TolB [Exilibacterium tricleocarpae]|nr:Tol-Pal system beta propeller repeat protein TolB [Exilibacterium tricleocarpae]